MTVSLPHAMARYVQVLDQRAEQAQQHAQQAQARLTSTQAQLQRLKSMGLGAGLKKSAGNVALYANAAGFRSGLVDMAEQCRDLCGVQQLEVQQAQQQAQHALRRHSSVDSVVRQAQQLEAQTRARDAQKVMDEMAAQAWMRQRSKSDGA